MEEILKMAYTSERIPSFPLPLPSVSPFSPIPPLPYLHSHLSILSLPLPSVSPSNAFSPTSPPLIIIIILLLLLLILMIIIIIIIAFKGTIRDFLQSPHSAANCLQHVRSSGPGAIVCKSGETHRMLITCKCHVTCHLVRRDSSAIKFDRVEIAFI